MNKKLIYVAMSILSLFFSSCASNRLGRTPPKTELSLRAKIPSTTIIDKGIKNSVQLTRFFYDNNPTADQKKVARLAQFYVTECAVEGINSDIAFCQMCLETGFLRFGGLVVEEMNNFCGLGAIDENQRGCIFETELIGVRAHVQHLKGYGTTTPLVTKPVDTRYKWINPKGKAPDIFGLSGTWAADPEYGNKLNMLLQRLANY
ncbi:MAG: hypothetical protein BKP49_02930 [Treponema sp. CETP13]|nr:MAG: hypothetical protein BKP49_02930 [Treponema sp. CETP13]